MSKEPPKVHYAQDAAPTPKLIAKGAGIPRMTLKPTSSNNTNKNGNSNSGKN